MPIPAQLAVNGDEEDFRIRFLIPLLQRPLRR
jgi:hypothetical protein